MDSVLLLVTRRLLARPESVFRVLDNSRVILLSLHFSSALSAVSGMLTIQRCAKSFLIQLSSAFLLLRVLISIALLLFLGSVFCLFGLFARCDYLFRRMEKASFRSGNLFALNRF